jgi:hypothetical protein
MPQKRTRVAVSYTCDVLRHILCPALLCVQGGQIIFFQSLAVLGYCLFPLVVRRSLFSAASWRVDLTSASHLRAVHVHLVLGLAKQDLPGRPAGAGCVLVALHTRCPHTSIAHTFSAHARRRAVVAALLRAFHRGHGVGAAARARGAAPRTGLLFL